MTLNVKDKDRMKGLYKDRRKQVMVGRIVNLHKNGYTNKTISNYLNISEDVVETYVKVYEDNKDRV